MKTLFSNFTKADWAVFISSLTGIIISNILSQDFDVLILIATLFGTGALIFMAKGNFMAHILIIVFSILYGIISFRFNYISEMITYLGMTLPLAVISLITWVRHPAGPDTKNEVKIAKMTPLKWIIILILAAGATVGFHFIMVYFNTPNIVFSTISITTSFLAAALTILRSPLYAIFYMANDVVLIILWTLATIDNPVYFPMIINFAIFLGNDLYAYFCWKKREALTHGK